MHTPKTITLWKPRGSTPLQAIGAWRSENLEHTTTPATYAGRLDPMAEGKLLVLLGDECKKKDRYLGLDKEYEIQVVLDIGTDTGDVLGMPGTTPTKSKVNKAELVSLLTKLTGTHEVPYPAYSSKTINGKPLFAYALEGTLHSIDIPTHPETIYSIQLASVKHLSKESLQKQIEDALSVVPRSDEPSKAFGADFRQDQIRAAWKTLFEDLQERDFTVLTLRVICGTGTYMRTLAERIATELDTTAFALSITRTKLGKYQRIGPVGFWTTTY